MTSNFQFQRIAVAVLTLLALSPGMSHAQSEPNLKFKHRISQLHVVGTKTVEQNLRSMSVSTRTLDFGDVNVGANSTLSVEVLNDGKGALTLSSASLDAPTSVSSTSNCGATLPEGASCTASVTFAPSLMGSMSGTLTLGSDAKNPLVSIALTGVGRAASGLLTANTSSVFGSVSVGATVTRTFTFTNTGNKPITNAIAVLQGTYMSLTANTCGTQVQPATVPAGASCSMTVAFAPAKVGPQSGSIRVSSSASNSPSTQVISGTGVSDLAASLSFDNNYIDALTGQNGTFQPVFTTAGETGTVALSDVQAQAGGKSALFTATGTEEQAIGNNGALVYPANYGLAFGTGDFTIEVYGYRTHTNIHNAYNYYSGYLLSLKGAGSTLMLGVDDAPGFGSVPQASVGGLAVWAKQFQVPLNTWVKYTLIRRAGKIQLRINDQPQQLYVGVNSNTPAGTWLDSTTNFTGAPQLIVGNQLADPRMWRGHIDSLRIYRYDITNP